VVEPTSLEPTVAELPSRGRRGRRYTTSTDVTTRLIDCRPSRSRLGAPPPPYPRARARARGPRRPAPLPRPDRVM